MILFRRHAIPLILVLIITAPAAQADISFNTNEMTTLSWPWPAAVVVDNGIFVSPGVVWADFSSVVYSFSMGTQVYHETVTPAANVGRISAITTNYGDIHACFQAQITDFGLRYAYRVSFGSWESEWVAMGADQGRSCAVGSLQGYGPVVVYTDDSQALSVLRFAYPGAFEWTNFIIDEETLSERFLTGVTVATDGQDAIHAAWSLDDEVRYWSGDGSALEVVTTGNNISSLSVAIGDDDQPRLAILDSGRMYYAVRNAKGWTVEPVLPERQSVMEMSLAFGYEDVPHIVFVTNDAEEPVFLATEFLGNWRDQPLTDTPTYGVVQRPTIAASGGAFPQVHLVAAWNGPFLNVSADSPNLPAFSVTRLRAAPLGELESTVELYSATQYLLENQPVIIDFTTPGVRDTVNFCNTWRDTLRRRTDASGTATFNMATGGAVTGGIRILGTNGSYDYPVLVESSVPMAGVDLEGNGSVTVTDRAWFMALMGTSDPRADLDFSGLVDEADLLILESSMGNNCTISGVDDAATTASGPRLFLHPNPASGPTTVSWRLPESSPMTLTIYDLAGRRVRDLVTDSAPAGERSVIWDGRDHRGRHVSAGVYLARLQAGSAVTMKRLVRVR